MCTVLVSLKASILHSAHFPLKKHSSVALYYSSVALYYSSVALYYRSVALYYSSVALTIVPLHFHSAASLCNPTSQSSSHLYIHSSYLPFLLRLPSFLLLRIDIEQCADMSRDLWNACRNKNMEEAMRLLSTATSEDVNYNHGVLVDTNCMNTQ